MDTAAAPEMLKRHRSELNRRGVVRAALFGSVARGEQRVDSDVDIIVELDPGAVIGV